MVFIWSILGDGDKKVFEFVCGIGEIMKVIFLLGYDVMVIDFFEKMFVVVWKKYSGFFKVCFVFGDVENMMEVDDIYDVIVCCYFVWMLMDLCKVIVEWLWVFKLGGKLIVFDGNWVIKLFIGWCVEIGVWCFE